MQRQGMKERGQGLQRMTRESSTEAGTSRAYVICRSALCSAVPLIRHSSLCVCVRFSLMRQTRGSRPPKHPSTHCPPTIRNKAISTERATNWTQFISLCTQEEQVQMHAKPLLKCAYMGILHCENQNS